DLYKQDQSNQQIYSKNNISTSRGAALRYENEDFDHVQLSINPRIIYLRKLYLAISIQLTLIGIFSFLCHQYQELETHLKQNYIYFWICIGGTIAIGVFGLCFRKQIRIFPFNVVCMLLWTLCFGMTLIYILSLGNTIVGLMAFILLSSLVLSQFFYSLTVRYELTYQGSSVFIFGAQLIVFHIFTVLSNISFFYMLFVYFLGFVFAFYLIFDTQSRITGPDYDFSKEEWISGTVLVYIDVMILITRIGDLLRNMLTKKQD
ncbi:hypothetical protein IMG5_117730, partial [Ichthyophthirius multifiliis]